MVHHRETVAVNVITPRGILLPSSGVPRAARGSPGKEGASGTEHAQADLRWHLTLRARAEQATRRTIQGAPTLCLFVYSRPQDPNLAELQATVMVLVQQPEEVQLADLHCAHCLLVFFSGQNLAAL